MDLQQRRDMVRQMARSGELVRTSDLNWAAIQPDVPCACGAQAGQVCPTPSGWHYSRRDALMALWREES